MNGARPSLFRDSDRTAIAQRIETLRPDTTAVWGKMDVAQMLAHCQVALCVATGQLKLRRSLVGLLFGRLAKRSLVGPNPFRRNLPTTPEFVVENERDFARERPALLALVQRFGEGGPESTPKEPHPFFGPLTPAEWDTLQWKHLDHHLQQFGA